MLEKRKVVLIEAQKACKNALIYMDLEEVDHRAGLLDRIKEIDGILELIDKYKVDRVWRQ